VFLDVSKAGARRWCTMNSCGNRAKAHRHYHKAKAAEK
jgi:predicted RNA-binding Zn ribbon-like protein